jgi:hypothetical protein
MNMVKDRIPGVCGLLQSRHCEEAERLKHCHEDSRSQSPNEQKEIASPQKAGLVITSDGLSMDNATAVPGVLGAARREPLWLDLWLEAEL